MLLETGEMARTTISDVWGTVHAMCGQELRMSE